MQIPAPPGSDTILDHAKECGLVLETHTAPDEHGNWGRLTELLELRESARVARLHDVRPEVRGRAGRVTKLLRRPPPFFFT